MELVILFLGGVVIGVLCHIFIVNSRKPSGRFIIDFSNPEKDFCRLDLDEDLNSIYFKKKIVLKVESHGYDSPN